MRAATGVALPPFVAGADASGFVVGRLGARLHRSLRRSGSRLDTEEHGADGHGLVGVDQDLGDRARHGRRHLGIDLVGRDLDERVIDGDHVAGLHEPLEHRALGDGIAHLGEGDVDQLAARPQPRRRRARAAPRRPPGRLRRRRALFRRARFPPEPFHRLPRRCSQASRTLERGPRRRPCRSRSPPGARPPRPGHLPASASPGWCLR